LANSLFIFKQTKTCKCSFRHESYLFWFFFICFFLLLLSFGYVPFSILSSSSSLTYSYSSSSSFFHIFFLCILYFSAFSSFLSSLFSSSSFTYSLRILPLFLFLLLIYIIILFLLLLLVFLSHNFMHFTVLAISLALFSPTLPPSLKYTICSLLRLLKILLYLCCTSGRLCVASCCLFVSLAVAVQLVARGASWRKWQPRS